MNKHKAVVLVSGGLDSAVCLALAVKAFGRDNVKALTMYYGQKHARELECARKLSQYYSVEHYEMDLSPVFKFSKCSLLAQNSNIDIPEGTYEEQMDNGGVSTYVPFRNGLFLATACSIALSLFNSDPAYIVYGAHADDCVLSAYPDCSTAFVENMSAAVNAGTGHICDILAPFIDVNKARIVEKGIKLGVPFQLTWSCYEGGDKPCGKCATCIDRAKAFKSNGIEDPALSEQ